jgi:hypothetical protein
MRFVKAAVCVMVVIVCFMAYSLTAGAEEKWPGVDKTVVEKFAKEHGREAKESLINTDQGDLLLFVFLIAGVAGGFVAGYYWRALFEGDPKKKGTKGGDTV